MSIRDRAKAKSDELVGRAEEVYGESHGDAAAEAHGEAVRLRGEAEENAELRAEKEQEEETAEHRRLAAEEATRRARAGSEEMARAEDSGPLP